MTWQPNRLPTGLAKICSEPGCGVIIHDGSKCEQHTVKRQRYSTNAWQSRRVQSITLAKRCAECGSTTDLVLHHVGSIDAPSATIVLCRACHTARHAARGELGR